MTPEWIQLQDLVTAHRGVETFSPEMVAGCPDAVRVVHAEGDGDTRSAAERAARESIWVPTALVRGAAWSQPRAAACQSNRIGVEIRP
jgi:hypothetical protein